MRMLLALLALCVSPASPALAEEPPVFRRLPDFVTRVSPDGSVAVGWSRNAYRWTEDGAEDLGVSEPGHELSEGRGASRDGARVVGTSNTDAVLPEGMRAFLWEDGVMTSLPLPDAYSASWAMDISSSGRTIVGTLFSRGEFPQAYLYRWGRLRPLGALPAIEPRSFAWAVSDDGGVVVGQSGDDYDGTVEAFRWARGVMIGLGHLGGDANYSVARGVSADGAVVVGHSVTDAGLRAFRWEAGVMTDLGQLSDELPFSEANAVSADGRVIVGEASAGFTSGDESQPFIWNEQDGMRDLQTVIEDLGVDVGDFDLQDAQDVSADGHTIVGRGFDADDRFESWIVVLPVERLEIEIEVKLRGRVPFGGRRIPVAILGSDSFDIGEIDVTTLALGPGGAPPLGAGGGHVRDVNRDDRADLVSHYAVSRIGLPLGASELCLTGNLIDGTPFRGCQSLDAR